MRKPVWRGLLPRLSWNYYYFFLSFSTKKSPQMRPSREKVCKSVISLTGHGDPICCVDGRDWMLIYGGRNSWYFLPCQYMLPIWIKFLLCQRLVPTKNKHFILCDSEQERKKRNWRLFNCHFFIQRFAFVNSSGSGIVMKNQQFIFLLFSSPSSSSFFISFLKCWANTYMNE